ncbi:MAG: hypothetical protein AAGJ85_05060 [Pseudomonadota bacterium]
MSLNRYAKKRDANEQEIVDIFVLLGFSVEQQDKPVDLLLGYGGATYHVEVKDKDERKTIADRPKALTPDQSEFFRTWRGQQPVVICTADEAMEFGTAIRRHHGDQSADPAPRVRKMIERLSTNIRHKRNAA